MNFDYIRLFLALVVMFGHLGFLNYGSEAVLVFFCISGYLITQSYQRSSLEEYFAKRIKRIYPPIFLLIGIAIIVGIFLRKSAAWFFSVLSLLLFQDLPASNEIFTVGVFWTLVIEFQFYLAVPIFFSLKKKYPHGAVSALVFLYIFSAFSQRILHHLPHNLEVICRSSIFIYSCYFIGGGFVSLNQEKLLKMDWSYQAVLIILLLLCLKTGETTKIALPFLIILGVLALAKCGGEILGKRALFGELSYGIYLYHYPIYKMTHSIKYSILITFFCAFISWHLVEKKFLQFNQIKM